MKRLGVSLQRQPGLDPPELGPPHWAWLVGLAALVLLTLPTLLWKRRVRSRLDTQITRLGQEGSPSDVDLEAMDGGKERFPRPDAGLEHGDDRGEEQESAGAISSAGALRSLYALRATGTYEPSADGPDERTRRPRWRRPLGRRR